LVQWKNSLFWEFCLTCPADCLTIHKDATARLRGFRENSLVHPEAGVRWQGRLGCNRAAKLACLSGEADLFVVRSY
jgi:hypothetical protein